MTGVWGRLTSVVMWYFTRVEKLDLVKFMSPSPILKKAMKEMDVTMNTGPDLEVSQNYRSKVLAENLFNTAS